MRNRRSGVTAFVAALLVGPGVCLGQTCAQGAPPTIGNPPQPNFFPFFANATLGFSTSVTIYGDDAARNYALLGKSAQTAAEAWGSQCPSGTYASIPSFQVNWNAAPPPNSPGLSHNAIVITFIDGEPPLADGSTTQVKAASWVGGGPGSNDRPSVINVYARCPNSKNIKMPDLGCNGTAPVANWGSQAGQTLIEHEIGHALGLGHDRSQDGSGQACPAGLMAFSPSTGAAILASYCTLANRINNDKDPCNESNPDSTQTHPCESNRGRIGGGPRGSGSGVGGGFCDDYAYFCNSGGPASWRGSGISCNYACTVTTDNIGAIISDGCAWGCFAAAAAGATSSVPINGVGPLLSVSSPAANQTLSGIVNVSGFAMQYFATATLSIGVDGSAAALTNFETGLASPQACQPPAGVAHYLCNQNSGFSAAFDTRTVANGAHTLKVVAISTDGWATSLDIPIVTNNSCFDITPPSVSFTSPVNSATVNGVVTVSVAASDDVAVTEASLYVDGAIVKVWSAPPYTYSWDTTRISPAVHTLQARAADGCGNTAASATVNVTAQPTLRMYIDSPPESAPVSGTSVVIQGWATDTASIASLAFSVDGSALALNAPYTYGAYRQDVCNVFPGDPNCPLVGFSATFNTLNLANGYHTIAVTATDRQRQTVTATRGVMVSNSGSTPLRVSIDAPPFASAAVTYASVSGTSVAIQGWASDTAGVTSVTFSIDGSWLALNAPYTYGTYRQDVCNVFPGDPNCPLVGFSATFNSLYLTNGYHTLAVTATDRQGQIATATRTLWVINNITSKLIWIMPQALAGYGPPGSLIVAGNAGGGPAGAGAVLYWIDASPFPLFWQVSDYAPIPWSDGTWLNSIPNADPTHQYWVYAVYDGVASSTCFYPGSNTIVWCP